MKIFDMIGFQCQQCKDTNECYEEPCQKCCPHDEFDHDICLDCGYERDPGAEIDKAMDIWENR